jgi:lipopolysaccharide export system protein LptA
LAAGLGFAWAVTMMGVVDSRSLAQPIEGGVRRGFSAAIVDPASGRREWLLEGDSVETVSKTLLEITGVRLRGYGEGSLVAITDRCFFDTQTTNIHSARKLRVEAGQGSFSIEGTGFELKLDQSQLTLSNEVHAVMDKRVLATVRKPGSAEAPTTRGLSLFDALPPAGSPGGPGDRLQIYSQRFNSDTNRATFLGDVRVEDETGTMTCQSLVIRLRPAERRLEKIVASGAVALESRDMRATATEAEYDPEAEAIELKGSPKWSWGERAGEADRAVVDVRTGGLHAWGHTRIQLPADSTVGGAGWLPVSPAASAAVGAESRPVQVLADDFTYAPDAARTNVGVAVCRGNVRVTDRRGQLSCRVLTVESLRPENRPLGATADGEVTVEQGNGRVTCDRSVYDAATGIIEMTGRPAWRFGERDGRSDVLRLDVSNRVCRALGDVRMTAAVDSFGRSPWLLPSPRADAPPPAAAGRPEAAPGPPVEIRCDEFEYRSAGRPDASDEAVYRRHVRVNRGDEMTLACDQVTATLRAGTNEVERVVARGGVAMHSRTPVGERIVRGEELVYTAAGRQVELKGPDGVEVETWEGSGRSVARGRRVTYDGERDRLELDGSPVLATPQGTLTGTRVWVDRSNSTFTASGSWKFRLPARALSQRAGDGLK